MSNIRRGMADEMYASVITRTVIDDIVTFGPELDEGQLLAVSGGLDGGFGGNTGGPCGACH